MIAEETSRLAIIGCGAVAKIELMPGLRRIRWLPSVLIDTSSRWLDEIARQMGRKGTSVIRASNWHSVANEFDAAIVALPHALHGPTCIPLLKDGKHVFIANPLATTRDELSTMIAAADRSNAKLSAGLYLRYLQVARWTKALLQSGVLGEIKCFSIREGFVIHSNKSADVLQPSLASGGILTDPGAHILDLMLWWFDDVESLNYYDDSEGGVAAECILECRLTSGAIGRIELSRTRHLRNSIHIEGVHGFVEVDLSKNEILTGSPDALSFRHNGVGAHDMKPQFVPELLDAQLNDFRASLSRTDQVGVSGHDAAKLVELIERCYAARQMLIQPWMKATSGTSPPDAEVTSSNFPRGCKILVTGATGFVGGRLVEQLIHEHGAQVRCTIRDAGRAARLGRLSAELVRMDLGNAEEVDRAVDGVDYVFNCAYDVQSRRQNTEGLRNLIEACARHSVRRLVQVSTFAVYEPFPDGALTEETRNGDRSNVYVDTKLDLEKMIFEAAHNRGVPATIVQPSIVYGPFCQVWTNTPAEMLIFGDVILPDRGEGLCNAVYIDDLVDGLILAAVSPKAVGERFIISGPQPVTWAKFFTEMARVLGTKPPKFWPREKITKENRRSIRNIRWVISDLKRLIKMAVRWTLLRRVLQFGIDTMPGPLRMRITKYYFGSGGRRAGGTFLPNRQALALYSSKAVTNSEKARSRLGYKPRFDFQRGMTLTGRYLEWAYEDIRDTAGFG